MIRNKKLKRIIVGGIGFVMAGVMFFVGSMQSMQEAAADVRVFDKITERYPYDGTYAGDNDGVFLNILEIVPDGETVTYTYTENNWQLLSTNENAEMGYFLRYYPKDQNGGLRKDIKSYSPTFVTCGTEHGGPIYNSSGALKDANTPTVLQNMRNYGLIKPYGADGAHDYPIYFVKDDGNNTPAPAFIQYKPDVSAEPLPGALAKGVYELGAGDYNIADGYTIDENGTICKEEHVSVSEDSTLSQNHPYDPVTNTVTILTPVTDDIDLTVMDFPRSKSDPNLEYITPVDDYENNKGKGLGNVKFTRSETQTTKTLYYGYSDLVIYYYTDGNYIFKSSNSFKEYVLGSGDKYDSKDIQYDVKVASTVTTADIEKADLVYISGTSARFSASATSDISKEVLLALYNKEVLNHKAIMMDYACYSADSASNVSKLAILLWRESQSEIRSEYEDAFVIKSGTTTAESDELQNIDFMTGDALNDLKASMMTGANGNFVTGNVYVYNHHMSDFDTPKSLVDAGDIFANGDFNSAYKASVAQQGFSDVLGYIVTTNKNSTTGQMLASVTPAVAIQYILISDGNPLTVMKNALHVLEIQPVTAFLYNETRGSDEYGYLEENGTVMKNRDAFIKSYLGNYYDDKADYITFTSMTIDEFNGRNDDLIETYDVIYIGSETTNKTGNLYYTGSLTTKKIVNKRYSSTETDKANLPVYNDSDMNGMVYYNIGDIVTTVSRNPQADGTFKDLREHLDIDTYQTRYNGRDLTKDKLQKLKNYLEADGLVLVAGDLVAQNDVGTTEINPTAVAGDGADVDHGRVDTSSNMYEFLSFARGFLFNSDSGKYENTTGNEYYKIYENLASVMDIASGAVNKTVLEKYIATEKLELTMMSVPTEYSYGYQAGTEIIDPDTITYMEEQPDGTRKLVYDFIITTLTADTGINTTYIPSLFIDVNKDGKYSKVSENIRDMQIVVKASGAEAPRDKDNNYLLSKGVEYQMTRELDDAYSGYLQWKINIQSTVDTNVHASAEGSTVVKNKGEDKLIKILQITKVADSTLDLEEQAETEESDFAKYLDAVPGYEVVFHTMTTQEFSDDFDAKYLANGNNRSVEEYALEYFDTFVVDDNDTENDAKDDIVGVNMLVFGYGDNFEKIPSTNSIIALQKFIESDKPVLMAHDFMIYASNHTQTQYLRNLLGADKYGVTQNIVDKADGETMGDLEASVFGHGLDYLHSGVGYTRSGDKDKVLLIESTGKNVAYEPSYKSSGARENTSKYTQGISNYTIYGLINKDGKKWLNSTKVESVGNSLSIGRGSYIAEKLNNGQITSYPYILKDEIEVVQTHAQHLELDLDADDDNDGESDVVVWYALGERTENKGGGANYNAYADDAAGPVPADSYYVYNKGNITYTGYGDSKDVTGFTSDEAQLFVNTLFAAFNADQVAPTAGFFETPPTATSTPVNGIAVPYDENVSEESSVLKKADGTFLYQFVNPNDTDTALKGDADVSAATPIYYRLTDTNFVRGKKYLSVEYYLKAEGNRVSKDGDQFRMDDGTMRDIVKLNINDAEVPVVDISKEILTYQVSEGRFANEVYPDDTGKLSLLESGVVYGFYLPMTYLKDDSHYTIYLKVNTKIVTDSSQGGESTVVNVKGEGYSELTVTKADLLDLD
ncbi:MAG: DUF5057 domain-containing protein [Lachnospiraceae bacterium]|nr:DUF5057 domain-containing protein [Lachnospiraceae bacterium]